MDAEVGKHPTLIGIPVKQTLICRPKTMYGTWIVHCKLDLSILKFQRFKNLYWVFKSLMNRSWDFKDLLIVQCTIAARGCHWHGNTFDGYPIRRCSDSNRKKNTRPNLKGLLFLNKWRIKKSNEIACKNLTWNICGEYKTESTVKQWKVILLKSYKTLKETEIYGVFWHA